MTANKLDPLLGPGGSHRKRGPYKPKNKLDGLLRFAIGGKYKWRRYEIFEQWLIKGCGFSQEKASEFTTRYQRLGMDNNIYVAMCDELREWKRICNVDRASKGGKSKAKKYPKWSQARRKRFMSKKKWNQS